MDENVHAVLDEPIGQSLQAIILASNLPQSHHLFINFDVFVIMNLMSEVDRDNPSPASALCLQNCICTPGAEMLLAVISLLPFIYFLVVAGGVHPRQCLFAPKKTSKNQNLLIPIWKSTTMAFGSSSRNIIAIPYFWHFNLTPVMHLKR